MDASSTLDRRFEGWEGVIHGGILCTILDEVMAWALVGEDNWGVTARMAVDFRRPVDGRHADPRRGLDHAVARRRIVDTAGRIVDADDRRRARDRDRRLCRGRARTRKRELRERYALPPDADARTGVATTTVDATGPARGRGRAVPATVR